jgi:radical SAM protein with 4Fe4S-binding SPASM domain
MVIDNYNDGLELNAPVRVIDEYCKRRPDIDKKVKIHIRRENEVLSTRGGLSPNNKKKKTLPLSCFLPYAQFVIRPDGKISLCCNDAYGIHTLGDVSEQSIKEVWYSKEFAGIREVLRKRNGRGSLDLCRYCDMVKKESHWKRAR